jgi:hypothetical protein
VDTCFVGDYALEGGGNVWRPGTVLGILDKDKYTVQLNSQEDAEKVELSGVPRKNILALHHTPARPS